MKNKAPARLHKAEPLTLEYNKGGLYLKGILFIILLFIFAFAFGSENINYILLSSV